MRNVLRYVQLYSFLEYSKNVLIFTNLPVYPSPQTKPSTLHIFLPEMLWLFLLFGPKAKLKCLTPEKLLSSPFKSTKKLGKKEEENFYKVVIFCDSDNSWNCQFQILKVIDYIFAKFHFLFVIHLHIIFLRNFEYSCNRNLKMNRQFIELTIEGMVVIQLGAYCKC